MVTSSYDEDEGGTLVDALQPGQRAKGPDRPVGGSPIRGHPRKGVEGRSRASPLLVIPGHPRTSPVIPGHPRTSPDIPEHPQTSPDIPEHIPEHPRTSLGRGRGAEPPLLVKLLLPGRARDIRPQARSAGPAAPGPARGEKRFFKVSRVFKEIMSTALGACSIDLRRRLGVPPRPIAVVPRLACAAAEVERCLVRQLLGRSTDASDGAVRALAWPFELRVGDLRTDVYDRRTGALVGLACRGVQRTGHGTGHGTQVLGPLDWSLFFRMPL